MATTFIIIQTKGSIIKMTIEAGKMMSFNVFKEVLTIIKKAIDQNGIKRDVTLAVISFIELLLRVYYNNNA